MKTLSEDLEFLHFINYYFPLKRKYLKKILRKKMKKNIKEMRFNAFTQKMKKESRADKISEAFSKIRFQKEHAGFGNLKKVSEDRQFIEIRSTVYNHNNTLIQFVETIPHNLSSIDECKCTHIGNERPLNLKDRDKEFYQACEEAVQKFLKQMTLQI